MTYNASAEGKMKPSILTFYQISDTHIEDSPDFTNYGRNPYKNLETFAAVVKSFPEKPDFIVHCGDISNNGGERSYELVSRALEGIRVPVYFVRGNHDSIENIRARLTNPDRFNSEIRDAFCYHFTAAGETFIVLDTASSEYPDPLGYIDVAQLEYAGKVIDGAAGRVTIFLHHTPFPLHSLWFDRNMVIVNWKEAHAFFVSRREKIRNIFCGHMHRPAVITASGITYCSVESLSWQYGWRAWDESPVMEPQDGAGYNVIRYFEDYSTVAGYRL